MTKKKVNYKSVLVLFIAIAVGLFLGNKLAYYQMYRLQINHEKTLSIALTAVNNEQALNETDESNSQDLEKTDEEAETNETNEIDKTDETDITVFPAKEQNTEPKSSADSESTNNQSQQENNTLVNINTADKAALDTLPGIGEVKAQAIIDYRNKYGKFLSTEEIMNVNGIGEKTYENLKDLICI